MRAFGIVYVHINRSNGKAYVGQTCQDTRRRWRKTDTTYNEYRGCTVFLKALKAHGWEAFDTIELVSCTNQIDLDYMEEYFIHLYDCVAPKGYNSLDKANGKVVYTQEVRDKIAKATKERMQGKPLMAHMTQRREHTFIDGVECKYCTDCDSNKPLSSFSRYNKTWDQLQWSCDACRKLYMRKWREKEELERKNNPIPRITSEDMPDLDKPIYAIVLSNNKTIKYPSMHSAGKYNPTAILHAVRTKTEYRGRMWYFS